MPSARRPKLVALRSCAYPAHTASRICRLCEMAVIMPGKMDASIEPFVAVRLDRYLFLGPPVAGIASPRTATISVRRPCVQLLCQPHRNAAIHDHRASRHEGRPVGKEEKG